MNITEKLAIQKAFKCLLLFRDGLFLKAYNESAYILTQLLKQDLKVRCYANKYETNALIIESAFQYAKLSSRLPNAVITDFGVRVDGESDLSGYAAWYAQCCHSKNEV